MQSKRLTDPLIEDSSLQTIYYDGITDAVVLGAIVRAICFEFRINPQTSLVERVAVCRLARPASATAAIHAEFTRAMNQERGLRLAD